MRRPAHNLGFTMIELILVLVVIAIMLAVAVPSLRGFGQGRKLDDTVDQFLAATRWAQSQAVADAQPLAIAIDSTANTYVVNVIDGETATPAAGEFGRASILPPGFTIALTSGGATTGPASQILFQPDARCTPATVRFTSSQGETADVGAASPAELFAKVVAK